MLKNFHDMELFFKKKMNLFLRPYLLSESFSGKIRQGRIHISEKGYIGTILPNMDSRKICQFMII